MFLNVMKKRNPELIKIGVELHQGGMIPPNTYIIDVDSVRENIRKIVHAADLANMELYFMSKQLGRFEKLAQIIVNEGITKAVAVDFDEGKVLAESGIAIGNIGHLVQPGKNQWEEVLSWKPEVVTIFSVERAKQLSDAADKLGLVQDIILKVYDVEDILYPGQEGGILLKDLPTEIHKIQQLKGIQIVGVTTFPNLELSQDKTEMVPTHNLATLQEAKKVLVQEGLPVKQVNGPSGTSVETIPYLSTQGITHSEPGHGITGTTPLHAYKDLPEKPAIIYVTEVSHQFQNDYQVIAGGFYGRSNMEGCFVGDDPDTILDNYTKAEQLNPESIDYYGTIKHPDDFSIEIGDTAIFAFRTQIFVTRAHVALVEGIQSGQPKLMHLERKW